MRHHLNKKRVVGLTVLAMALAGVAAYAYFTTSGSGTGTATVGTSTPITIHATTTGSLYPGTSVPVAFTADNPSTGTQLVGTVTLTDIKACAGGTWTPGSGCGAGTEITSCESFSTASSSTAANYSMVPVIENQQLAGSSSGTALTAGGTLTMNNLASNQDACKNASLYLTFSS